MRIVRQYTWKPNTIIIESPHPGKGYKKLSDDKIDLFIHADGTTKLYFHPEKFPTFEITCARFARDKGKSIDRLETIIGDLIYFQQTSRWAPLSWLEETSLESITKNN
jgi:hypothetical protein